MSLIQETDYGTPKSKSSVMVTLEIDGQSVTVPESTSDHAGRHGAWKPDPETLRHRQHGKLWFMPPLPG